MGFCAGYGSQPASAVETSSAAPPSGTPQARLTALPEAASPAAAIDALAKMRETIEVYAHPCFIFLFA